MSGHVPPQRPSEDELEELGDDVIIAQESLAHVPSPRARVRQERESVVISDRPPPDSGVAPRRRSGRGEATVVIRDKRRIEEMRKAISSHRATKPKDQVLLLWAGAALAAFLVGGVVALIATRHEPRLEAPVIAPGTPSVEGVTRSDGVSATRSATDEASKGERAPKEPAPVKLEDLPVERPTRK